MIVYKNIFSRILNIESVSGGILILCMITLTGLLFSYRLILRLIFLFGDPCSPRLYQIPCAQFSSNLFSSNFFHPIHFVQSYQVRLGQDWTKWIGRKQEEENKLRCTDIINNLLYSDKLLQNFYFIFTKKHFLFCLKTFYFIFFSKTFL